MNPVLRLLASLVLLSGLPGCEKHSEWHQKLTISVETPEGIRTASGVTAVVMTDTTKMWVPPEGRRVTYKVTGEALVMEVANGKFLFVLLKGLPNAPKVFLPDIPREEAGPRIATLRETRELTPKQYPLLVTFDDIADPTSVKRVDPANLEASFGPGYRVKSIAMSITDESVIEGRIQKMLGWLGPYPEPKLSPATGRTTDIPFSRSVSHGDFIRR